MNLINFSFRLCRIVNWLLHRVEQSSGERTGSERKSSLFGKILDIYVWLLREIQVTVHTLQVL